MLSKQALKEFKEIYKIEKMENNLEFRQKLRNITTNPNVSIHPELINDLQAEFSHNIKLEELVSTDREENFNCFMYVFDLQGSKVIRHEMKKKESIKFGRDYIDYLIRSGYLAPNEQGKIIIYFDDTGPTHAGIINGNRIISKWGIGNLWQHDLWEVTINYGNNYNRYEKKISSEDIEEKFANWVRLRYYSKIGRNDPCYCGSKKKYKKCCGK